MIGWRVMAVGSVCLAFVGCGVEALPVAPSTHVSTESAAMVIAASRDGNRMFEPPLFTLSASAAPDHAYALTFASFDQCAWVEANDPSSLPLNFTMLRVYLLHIENGQILPPIDGTYQVMHPGQNGLFIDPDVSGFGFIQNCKGTWPGLMFGRIVVQQLNSQTAGGSVDITLTDGTRITGAFGSVTCAAEANNHPQPAANSCISVY